MDCAASVRRIAIATAPIQTNEHGSATMDRGDKNVVRVSNEIMRHPCAFWTGDGADFADCAKATVLFLSAAINESGELIRSESPWDQWFTR